MKKLLLFLLLCVPMVGAQDIRTAAFMTAYDLDATSYTYCVITGQNEDPFSGPIREVIPIATSGSSTTVAAVTAGTEPFLSIAVGDTLLVNRDGTWDIVYVATRTDADNITVSSAVNWENGGSGRSFYWYDRTCGTAATNGWIKLNGKPATLDFQIDQMTVAGGSAGIYAQVECRNRSTSTATPVYPPGGATECKAGLFTTTGQCAVSIEEPWLECRIGFKIDTGDDAGDTVTESITALLTTR